MSVGAPIGNQNARKAKRWEGALTRALARVAEGAGVEAGLDKIADVVVAAAIDGDRDAWQEVANRLDGKVPQAIIGGNDEDPAIKLEAIAVKLVRPDGA